MFHRQSTRLIRKHPAKFPVDADTELRIVREDDAAAIFALTDANRAHLRRWLPWVDNTRSVADTRAFALRSLEQLRNNDGFQTTVWHRGQLVGVVGFHYFDWTNKRTEIGYWLAESFQGRGIMTRACQALVDYAFRGLGLNRIEIRVAPDNARSQGIPRRLGFREEGTLREVAWLNDRFIDLVVYSLLREDRPAGPLTPSPRGVSRSL